METLGEKKTEKLSLFVSTFDITLSPLFHFYFAMGKNKSFYPDNVEAFGKTACIEVVVTADTMYE